LRMLARTTVRSCNARSLAFQKSYSSQLSAPKTSLNQKVTPSFHSRDWHSEAPFSQSVKMMKNLEKIVAKNDLIFLRGKVGSTNESSGLFGLLMAAFAAAIFVGNDDDDKTLDSFAEKHRPTDVSGKDMANLFNSACQRYENSNLAEAEMEPFAKLLLASGFILGVIGSETTPAKRVARLEEFLNSPLSDSAKSFFPFILLLGAELALGETDDEEKVSQLMSKLPELNPETHLGLLTSVLFHTIESEKHELSPTLIGLKNMLLAGKYRATGDEGVFYFPLGFLVGMSPEQATPQLYSEFLSPYISSKRSKTQLREVVKQAQLPAHVASAVLELTK